jgi:DNA-binding NtrC family response regulator
MAEKKIKILFADDNWKKNRWDMVFSEEFADEDIIVEYESLAEKVLERFNKDASLQLLLLDLMFDGQELQGKDVLKKMEQEFPDIPVIILSSNDSIETALDYVKDKGAYYYFSKNSLDFQQISIQIKNAVNHYKEKNKILALENEVQNYRSEKKIVGDCEKIKNLNEQIENVALTPDSTVLIIGETGTGKNLVANAIQTKSDRRESPFIIVNCGALPDDLIENELFGHEKGAFTGAEKLKKGKFELANTGTLFLDEIGELRTDMQVKLLHVLQSKEIQRLGSSQNIHVDVRVLAATNRNLAQEVENGKFRKDLFYRLNVIQIKTVPLRELKSDIPLLISENINKLNHRMGRSVTGLTEGTMGKFLKYSWPGNVRELESCLERAFALTMKSKLQVLTESLFHFTEFDENYNEEQMDEISGYLTKIKEKAFSFDDVPAKFQSEIVKKILQETTGNGRQTSEILNIDYDKFRKKLQKWNIKTIDFR